MSPTVKVDIWSDIACPWCFVGKRRFEQGAAEFGGEVEVEYHSFELSPDTPVSYAGSEAQFLAEHKRIPQPQAEHMLAQMTEIAAGEGLAYDFAALRHANTVLAHQALHLAKARGRQVELKERLLRAYFEEGRDLNRIEQIAALAADVGLDAAEVTAALTEDRYLEDVRADQRQAVEYGIGAVPFFVVGGRFAVSGAQEPAVFAEALRRAAQEPA
ncbi:MAG: DsbA family oxidoreductase [Aeromicrobium sp.]|uniref:DsbA family oxidoreductase n=1 Tax=Aeromicrobium sp. TaxID=1871063 RepID=UPI0039E3F2E2